MIARDKEIKDKPKQLFIDREHADRRIDNFLISHYKNVPKSRIYQMLRRGEVRVDQGRIKPSYRLQTGNMVRIPPVYMEKEMLTPPKKLPHLDLQDRILYQDQAVYIFDKPTGFAVHAGSHQRYGFIECLKFMHHKAESLELVHRLDKSTSGCLLISRNMTALRYLHQAIRDRQIKKTYHALLCGELKDDHYTVETAIQDHSHSGGRRVAVTGTGRKALSYFNVEARYPGATLVRVEPVTGRTHQIRVHSQHIGHPIAGDYRYGGGGERRRWCKQIGLKRLFLHATQVGFISPDGGKKVKVRAPLPIELENCLIKLDQ